jgi:hypothetical protein
VCRFRERANEINALRILTAKDAYPMSQSQTVVFWSWQSDSPAATNRNFIEDCLERAIKQLGKISALIIRVDRDTKGVGGTPSIADTILAKIRASDVFVWDATLVSAAPRFSPNPNVLLELGYALAVLGDGRIIGIMNTYGTSTPEDLPFDLKHRRWPITYALEDRSTYTEEDYEIYRKSIRDSLVDILKLALHAALKEPKGGAVRSDVDLHIASTLWNLIDSSWMRNWYSWRTSHPQYEHGERFDLIEQYISTVSLPENVFKDESLRKAHDTLCSELNAYGHKVVREMVWDGHKTYVIRTKTISDWVDDYDERYERECNILIEAIEAVWVSWERYIDELRVRYPEVIYSIKST